MAQNSSNRGFAGMDPEKQREIAAKGGKASHQGDSNNRDRRNRNNRGGNQGGGTMNTNR